MKYLILFFSLVFFISPVLAKVDSKLNGEHITISGIVSEVGVHSLIVNTGGKKIHVEMENEGWAADGYKLMKGDQVVVTGKIDQDFQKKKRIQAGSIYVKNLDTYYYSNKLTREDPSYFPTNYSFFPSIPDGVVIDVKGYVTNINGRKFTIDTGLRRITVDTSSLIYNPFDSVGNTKIQQGDRVRAAGKLEKDFFETKEVSASLVTEFN